MLLILTGDIQIGKTRWLQSSIERLEAAGVECHGVVAPGIWAERADGTLDKLGIDNLLLPGHELVPFARRADIAQKEGTFDKKSQAGRAQLRWHISDDSIAYVNEHFKMLQKINVRHNGSHGNHVVLFVDELGQLELLREEGLTEAMKLLSSGPKSIYSHAVVVARNLFGLPERVEELFSEAWGGCKRITPDEETFNEWFMPLIENDRS